MNKNKIFSVLLFIVSIAFLIILVMNIVSLFDTNTGGGALMVYPIGLVLASISILFFGIFGIALFVFAIHLWRKNP